jgi:hypothetical protein
MVCSARADALAVCAGYFSELEWDTLVNKRDNQDDYPNKSQKYTPNHASKSLTKGHFEIREDCEEAHEDEDHTDNEHCASKRNAFLLWPRA